MPGSFHADKTDPLFSDSCMGALCPLQNFRCPRRYLPHELYYYSDLAAIININWLVFLPESLLNCCSIHYALSEIYILLQKSYGMMNPYPRYRYESMRNIVRVVPNEIFPPKILHTTRNFQNWRSSFENEIISSISSSYVKEILFFLLYSSKKLNSSKRL